VSCRLRDVRSSAIRAGAAGTVYAKGPGALQGINRATEGRVGAD